MEEFSMSSKAKKIFKLIILLTVIFALINAFAVLPVFAGSTAADLVDNATGGTIKIENGGIATGVKFVSAFVQILVIGYFSIRLTIVGIRYMIAVTVDEKVAKRTALRRTFFWAVIVIALMYGIIKLLGL